MPHVAVEEAVGVADRARDVAQTVAHHEGRALEDADLPFWHRRSSQSCWPLPRAGLSRALARPSRLRPEYPVGPPPEAHENRRGSLGGCGASIWSNSTFYEVNSG